MLFCDGTLTGSYGLLLSWTPARRAAAGFGGNDSDSDSESSIVDDISLFAPSEGGGDQALTAWESGESPPPAAEQQNTPTYDTTHRVTAVVLCCLLTIGCLSPPLLPWSPLHRRCRCRRDFEEEKEGWAG